MHARGLNALHINTTNWFTGPIFFWERELHTTPSSVTELLVGEPEVKTAQTFATEAMSHSGRLSQFSSWKTLLKVVARIKRLGSRQKTA